MKITAEELMQIVREVENIKDYNERLSEITEILYKFYNEMKRSNKSDTRME